MSDPSLRERLAQWGFAPLQISNVEHCILEHLSANGLAIVPVEATEAIHQAVADAPVESTFNELWQAMLAAAPPAADLLKGTQDE